VPERKTSRGAVLGVVCLAQFLMPFMMSAVGIALPEMGREFTASALQLGLVETAYVMSASICLLAMGRLGDIHGRRRVFKLGLVLFTVAGGIISMAWSIHSIIFFRLLQGIGGAMVMATGMAMVVSVFPAAERGKALGIVVASVYAGISLGPFIGGHLVAGFGWRSLFHLLLPLGLVAWIVTHTMIGMEWRPAAGERFDRAGLAIYAPAIVLLVVGVANLRAGWWPWLAIALSAGAFGAFARWEARCAQPLLDVRLLRDNRVFALSNLAALFNYAATFGVAFFLSLYLQYVKGMGPQQAGTVLIIQPIVQAVLSPACGRLSDRVSASLVATVGMASCAVGLAIAAFLGEGSPLIMVYSLLGFLGLGFALFSSPNTSMVMGSVEPRHLGVASGLNATMRTLGMMTSMMVITLVFAFLMGGQGVTAETEPQFLASMRLALLVFCAFCVVGIGCSVGRVGRGGRTGPATG
jgi:MFS family permease